MKNLLCIGLIMFLIVSCETNKESPKTISTTNEEDELYVNSNRDSITIRFNDRSFSRKIENDQLNFPYNGDTNNIAFLSQKDTLQFELQPGESIPVYIILNQIDTFLVSVKGRPKPANFSNDYIAANRGTYDVRIPEVHELINIAFSLTEIGQRDNNLINQQTEYYRKVQNRFAKYADHPLISLMTENMQSGAYEYYYNLKMNACMYTFRESGEVVNNSPYDRLGWGDNQLKDHLKLIEDFASTTDFRGFYTDHEDYYNSLKDTYHEVVPVKRMWNWLEERFSDRYDSYKIYFSPLVGGAHATQKYSDNGYKETIMFVNAPIFPKDYTPIQKEIKASRVVFTEIDHNYINPVSDNLSDEINQSFSKRFYWVLDDPGLNAYPTPYSVFNEYMTWSLFSLYCKDEFPTIVSSEYLDVLENTMIRKRGFIKFDKFNRKVIELYNFKKEMNGSDLIKSMLNWSKSAQDENNK